MKKLIVIPARGGSKGIPKKNIYPINGKPLLEYTLDIIKEARLKDTDVAVSTDSAEIKRVAAAYDDVYIVDRPYDISGDTSPTEATLLHALEQLENKQDVSYDAVLTLQPTSPLRKVSTLRAFIAKYEEIFPEYDALLSLNEDRVDHWKKGEQGFERLNKNAPRRRQDREPLYIENSAYYITDVRALRRTGSVLGTCADGFLISDVEAIDINNPADLRIAECYLNI